MKTILALLAALLTAAAARAATPTLVPLPVEMQVRTGVFTLCPPAPAPALPGHPLVKIYADAVSQPTAEFLAAQLFQSTGWQFTVVATTNGTAVRNGVLLTTANANTNLNTEGYELTVAPDSVVVRAPASAGVFFGVQSLLQLLPPQVFAPQPAAGVAWTVPCVYVFDQPRFPWRGWMLDCSRHFFSKDEVKQLIAAMALLKLNTLHWHLVDDEGWRIEILKYPLLTQVGAWRTNINILNSGFQMALNPRASTAWNTNGLYGGYYTQADIREIVAYAQQRHITIVPEIEMPGHSTAALQAYPQFSCDTNYPYSMDDINYTYDVYSPGTPGTIPFLEDVLTEVISLFPGKYIHCGGDEVVSTIWNTYPPDETNMEQLGITPGSSTAIEQYQYWFSSQIANFLQSKGRTMIGWSEIDDDGVLGNAAVMDYEGTVATTAAEAGQPVVVCPSANCYFDSQQALNMTWSNEPPSIHPTESVPLGTVYGFEPVPSGLSAPYSTNIIGAQGNQWCEYVPSALNVQFKSYPRLCAIAELDWTPAAQKNFTGFTNRLTALEQRFTQMNFNFNRTDTNAVSVPAIGTWTPSQISATAPTTLSWNITTNVTAAGEIDVSFASTSGANGLDIAWTALLQNGTQVDLDTHSGFALSSTPTVAVTNAAVYVLRLPAYKPGATYTVSASVQGTGGTNTAGTVFLPNWN